MNRFFQYQFVAILTFLSFVTITHASVLKVNTTSDGVAGSLRSQITAANPGDTVFVDISGTMFIMGSTFLIDKPITIIGPTAAHFTIDGNSFQFLVSTAAAVNVNIEGIRFINSPCPCGPFFNVAQNSILTIKDCVFEGLTTGSTGGAINMANTAQLIVKNSSFFNCTATANNGGAIFIGIGNTATIINCTFSANSGVNGGAIFCSGIAQLVNNTFINNTSSGDGHAIASLAGAAITLQNNIFTDISVPKCNTICFSGGAPNWTSNGGNVYSAGTPFGFITAGPSDIIGSAYASIGLRANAIVDGYGLKYFPIESQLGSAVDNGTTGALVSSTDTRRAPRAIYGDNLLNPDAGACEFTPFTVTSLSGATSIISQITAINGSSNPGQFYIDFDIAAPGITSFAAASQINKSQVFIDGYTQPGSKVYGPGAITATVTPFVLPNSFTCPAAASAILINGSNVRIDGIAFNNGLIGIECNSTSGIELYGNKFDGQSNRGFFANATTTIKIGAGRYHAKNVFKGIGSEAIFMSNCIAPSIQGNFIGLNELGNASAGNANGIRLNDCFNGIIGGSRYYGQANIISGNSGDGIGIYSGNNLSIHGNNIGLDYTGLIAMSNGFNGIYITSVGSTAMEIGKPGAHYRNYICNSDLGLVNNGAGIKIENHIAGLVNIFNNYIGLNASNIAAPNATGVSIVNSAGIHMGDASPSQRNIVSGNNGIGIYMDGALCNGNYFNKNFIGIGPNNAALPNGNIGFHLVNGVQNTTIINHVVSGNGSGSADGISLNSAGINNNISGNFIGTDSTGSIAIPNDIGVKIESSGTGTLVANNIISGNISQGIYVNTTPGIQINSNMAGVNMIGSSAIPNGEGMALFNCDNFSVTSNTISSNTGTGLFIGSGTNGQVRTNYIGTNSSGANLGNGFFGMAFFFNSFSNTVGGIAPGDYNVFAYNAQAGLSVQRESFNVGILGNHFFQNVGMAINLEPNNSSIPLSNDVNDADVHGPALPNAGNDGQNKPDNLIASFIGGTTQVSGSMNVDNVTNNYLIQVYKVNPGNVDPTGFGEGDSLIGSITINSPGSNNFSFVVPVSGLSIGEIVSATCTKINGAVYSTSEFSDTTAVRAGLVASIIDSADVSCNGLNDGMAQVGTASGIGPYSYAWFTTAFVPTGITTDIASTLGPGSYVCIVNDIGCGCSDTSNVVTITQPLPLAATVSPAVNPSCFGACNGSITLLETGGVGPYQYSVDNGATFFPTNIFTALCAGTYNYIVEDANGCSFTNTSILTAPPIVTATPTITHESCSGLNDGSISFVIGGGVGPYEVSDDNGVTFIPGSNLTNLPPGSVFWVVGDANGCLLNSVATINSGAVLTPNFTSTPACENVLSAINDASTVSIGTITGWSWTFTGGSPSSSILQNNSVQFPVSGTPNVTLIVTSSTGCTDTITLGVTIYDNPVPFAGLDTNICVGIPFTHNATVSGGVGPYVYSWSPAVNLVSSSIEDPVLTAAAINTTGITSYNMSVSDLNGCVGSDIVIVTVNALPTVSGGIDQTVCSGNSVTLVGTGTAASYSWNNSVTNGTAFSPTATLNYIVTGTNAAGCQNTDTVTVTVEIPYTVNAGLDFAICSSSPTITLSGASSSPSVVWSTNGTGTFVPSVTSLNPTYSLNSADTSLGTLFFVLTTLPSGSCPAQDDTIFVTITAGADASFSYTDSTICKSDLTIYTVTAATAGGIYGSVGAGLSINTITGAITPSTSLPGIYQVYHVITTPCLATDTITIVIISPVVFILPQHLGCYGDTIEFLANVAGGTWSGISLGLNSTSGVWINWLSGTGFHTVTYTYTDPATGCSGSDTNKIFIRPAPITTITGVTGPYCPSDGPIVVTGNPAGGVLYLNSVFQGVTTFNYDPNLIQTDTIIYVYQDPVTLCYGYASLNVVVSPTPATPILSSSPPFNFCSTSPTTLSVSNPSSTVSWYADAAQTILLSTGVSISTALLPGGTNTIYVVNEVGTSCASSPLAITYTKLDASLINFGGPYVTCPSSPITINMTINFGSATVFQWAADSSINDVFAMNPVVGPSQTTTYYVSASASILPGCVITDSITVTVQPCSLDEVTNAFSPDGDNVNDTWIINGIQLHPNNNVSIFNRWGDKMIEIKEYDNVTRVWDGKYKGSLVAAGTYYFIIQYFDDGQQKAGWIQVSY